MNNKIKDDETNDFYFKYHHSAGDSMLMMDPVDMDDNVIAIAAMMYMVAEFE
jgi:carboxypeptidase Q